MALILCIETATTNCSVALASDDRSYYGEVGVEGDCCLALKEDRSDSYGHGEQLHVFIDRILKNHQLSPKNLDAIAVSIGPGSYTGLRIGVAAAKGLAFALDIPLIGISTLESIANLNTTGSRFTIACLDARRMEVYAAVYEGVTLLEEPRPIVLDGGSFFRFRESGTTTIIGTAVIKFKNLLGPTAKATFVETLPSARSMCCTALYKLKQGSTSDTALLKPVYLKEFKAG